MVQNTTNREFVNMLKGQEAVMLGVPFWHSDDGPLVPKDRKTWHESGC